jgi:hypothetical protein
MNSWKARSLHAAVPLVPSGGSNVQLKKTRDARKVTSTESSDLPEPSRLSQKAAHAAVLCQRTPNGSIHRISGQEYAGIVPPSATAFDTRSPLPVNGTNDRAFVKLQAADQSVTIQNQFIRNFSGCKSKYIAVNVICEQTADSGKNPRAICLQFISSRL